MRSVILSSFALCALALSVGAAPVAAEPGAAHKEAGVSEVMKPIPLWQGVAPGDKGDIGEERDTSPANEDRSSKSYVSRIGFVSQPTITVYKPPKEKDTGAAVVVCPGGGYSILAMNLEGSEVCEWLNSIGVTGILLKYRVPARKERERYAAPLQDVQRAVGIARSRAKEWNIDPARTGVLGFSAGGNLAAALCANNATRTYPAVDDADKESCRPSFAILIYPAYLATDDLARLAPEVKVTPDNPPTFITMTQDDPVHVEGALLYALALKQAKVPFELHVYPRGGHGYGLRPSENLVSEWPQRAAGWLETQGWLKPRK
jgi:acetyl esterase/lipase